jgi:hypothetical protein
MDENAYFRFDRKHKHARQNEAQYGMHCSHLEHLAVSYSPLAPVQKCIALPEIKSVSAQMTGLGLRLRVGRQVTASLVTSHSFDCFLSADSALTAYSACAVTRIAVCSDSSSSSLSPPAPADRRGAPARPGPPGGRVRPAADGRAGPFRFRKELYRSSRNVTSPEGTRDSGRTFVLQAASTVTRRPVTGPAVTVTRTGWRWRR